MIAWTKRFPEQDKPEAYRRIVEAREKFFEHYAQEWLADEPEPKRIPGYQNIIADWRNRYKGQRCFVIGNGPSLDKMDLTPLKDEITIGCNGIYKRFSKWGFTTNYLVLEDIEQTESRRKELPRVKGPLKMAALYNAYALPPAADTVFFNVPRTGNNPYYFSDAYPQFSKDFSGVVHLGSTVTYIMLQLAYHFGCDPVYIIGVDHNYGNLVALTKHLPGRHLLLTEENMHLVKTCYGIADYYKPGDLIGGPWVEKQEQAYRLARTEFETVGRRIINAGVESKLDVFQSEPFDTLF
nr:6-hydroxymethylpterin diphosphokinase MptE-like protein [uncultured Desulfobacter sp.]